MNRKPANIVSFLGAVILGSIVLAPGLKANEANYQQYVVGDRAAGMGGAACALGTALDASYYNPAGLAFTKQRTISVSASLYGWQRYREDGALYPDEDLKTSSFITVPPAMGVVLFAATNTAVGLAAFVPYNYSLSDILAFPRDNNYYNVSLSDQTIWVGPSAAHAFSKELSVGVGAYGVYRNYSDLQTVYLNNYSYSGTRSIKYKTFALLATAGLQYRPTDRWRLGLSAQSPSMALWGNGEYQSNESGYFDNTFLKEFNHSDNMDAQNRTPAKFTAGIGWEKEKSYGVGFDVSWHLANSYNRLSGTLDESGEDVYAKYINQGVVDMNVGAEYYILNAYPIRAGFYTSRSSAPDIQLENEGEGYPGQINQYGLTASVGRELENVNMSLGVNYIFGDGNDYGYTIEKETDKVVRSVITSYEKQFYIFFNTSYMF